MKLNPSQIAELRAATGQRGGTAAFARKYSIHPPTVRRWAKELGFGSHGKERIRRVEAVDDQAAHLKSLIPADTRDLTARLMGDPIPQRSALAMRERA